MRKLRSHEEGVQTTEEEDRQALLRSRVEGETDREEGDERDGERLPTQAPTCILCGEEPGITGVTIDGQRRPCCKSCKRAYTYTRRIHSKPDPAGAPWRLHGVD